MSNVSLTLERLAKLQPLDIVRDPAVRERFITIYDTLWGPDKGQPAYEKESLHFNALLRDNEAGKLLRATPFSIFNAFIDLAVCGLSLAPGAQSLAYLTGRNFNIGTREKPVWEGRCVLVISAYGELVMRQRAGQIRHVDNPVLVYDNDEFSFRDVDGRKSVSYTCNLPHAGHNITACYLRITRADGTIDYAVMLPEDWCRLASYSAKQNRGQANALYGIDATGIVHIDPGFLMAKCIRHAFKTYPKVRIGRGTEFQSQEPDTQDLPDNLYDLPADRPAEAQTFAPAPDLSAGVTVNPDTQDDVF